MNKVFEKRLQTIYPDSFPAVATSLTQIANDFKVKNPHLSSKKLSFSEKDTILITYADHVHDGDKKTLPTMHEFLNKFIKGYINTVHFLPFYPYSSDDGFSVIDYYKIKEEFGTWEDVSRIAKDFDLMFDLVINHTSQHSEWFKEFLKGNPEYENFFIAFDNKVDTSLVFRPRTHPLLTLFETKKGSKYVWTTFSDDQIDLNFENPEVLLEMINVLLFYIENGAKIIRLDAIGYLWKTLGTSSIHLSQTHEVVKLFRDVINEVAPNVWIITETNVPHKDNISYFGNGDDEAHLVYNFTLPPLLLHTMLSSNSSELTKWAQTLAAPGDKTTFFNFTASHDGIGVTPLHGIVPIEDINNLADSVLKAGGKVNFRDTPEGKKPYELNCVYFSVLNGNIDAFLATQTIQMAMQGVPAIYLNSIIGAQNWTKGVETLKYNRAINREKFDYTALSNSLADSSSVNYSIYSQYTKLLKIRTAEPLFNPLVNQKIHSAGDSVFVIERHSAQNKLFSVTNVTSEPISLDLSSVLGNTKYTDILENSSLENTTDVKLQPYQTMWLK
ncbi:MAG: sugar phosphorylase [Candidatus Levybacteria bacterium]|nr:sugar phosphorylase [Candidatus Levybacteria bacterium]